MVPLVRPLYVILYTFLFGIRFNMVNPAPNEFKRYFPELRKLITFTCADDGRITEETQLVVKDLDLFHEIIAGYARGMDVV